MYKFQNNPEDGINVDEAIQDASDPASTTATPEGQKSTQDILNQRLVSMLDPTLQQRYKDRRDAAIAQQDASYQGPAAIQALSDGENVRALQTGLQRAANKFGSVGGDGGQKSDFGDTAKAMDNAAKQNYALKDASYKSGVKAEDDANNDNYQNTVARPLALKEGINTLDKSDRDAELNAKLDPLKVSNATLANQTAQLDFKNQEALSDPNSPESAQVRAFAKGKYPSLNVADTTSAAQLYKLVPMAEAAYKVDIQSQSRKDAAEASANARADAASDKADAKTKATADAGFKTLSTRIEADIGRSGNFGKTTQTINAGKQALALYDQTGGNPSPQQMFELAKSVDALVSGGSGTTVNGTSHLVPESAMGDASKFANWLTNTPGGAGQQEFAKQLHETILREMQVAQDRKNEVTSRVVSANYGLRSADKDRFDTIVLSQGLNPDDFDEKGRYKTTASASKGSASSAQPSAPTHGSDLP